MAFFGPSFFPALDEDGGQIDISQARGILCRLENTHNRLVGWFSRADDETR